MLPIALAACTSVGGGAAAGEGGASLTDAADESVVACQGPQDCRLHFTSVAAVWCCVDRRCVFGQSAEDAVHCTDASPQVIQASNYDQTCQTDSDCIAVAEGEFCQPRAYCPSATISKSASAQYWADVGKTNAALCDYIISGCLGGIGTPCCRSGKCTADCVAPADTLATCAGAGGSCVYGAGPNACGSLVDAGPPDSCAYSDETCCVR